MTAGRQIHSVRAAEGTPAVLACGIKSIRTTWHSWHRQRVGTRSSLAVVVSDRASCSSAASHDDMMRCWTGDAALGDTVPVTTDDALDAPKVYNGFTLYMRTMLAEKASLSQFRIVVAWVGDGRSVMVFGIMLVLSHSPGDQSRRDSEPIQATGLEGCVRAVAGRPGSQTGNAATALEVLLRFDVTTAAVAVCACRR